MDVKRAARLLVLMASAALVSVAATASSSRMGADDARHLLARTGFGPTVDEVQAFASLTRAEAIERLLADTRLEAATPAPPAMLDTSALRRPGASASPEERRAFRLHQLREGLELRAWWIREMTTTPSPLTERMTLFWHNHFVSSQQKVRIARLMYRQNRTLRANALGDFGTLLHAAAKDAAMLIYLDAVQNRRGQPNENFAREVMELFTLGEGRYAERDVKEAARAFTGWSLERDSGEFRFRKLLHDDGEKTLLGETGRFDGDQVLDMLLARPETAEHIVAKLWREFVSDAPDASEVRRIGARFRASGYSIKAALRELLSTDAFWAEAQRGTLVKSPVELVVGALRQLGMPAGDGPAFAIAAAGMGQNLFSPPNVKGWAGGEAWINAATFLARKQFLERVARVDAPAMPSVAGGESMDAIAAVDDDRERGRRFARLVERGMRELQFDASGWLARQPGASREAKVRAAQALLLPLPAQSSPAADVPAVTLVRATLLDPSYQLK